MHPKLQAIIDYADSSKARIEFIETSPHGVIFTISSNYFIDTNAIEKLFNASLIKSSGRVGFIPYNEITFETSLHDMDYKSNRKTKVLGLINTKQ